MTNLCELITSGASGVSFDALTLARELEAYGEPEAAELMLKMTPATHAKISEAALRFALENQTIDKAICLAAVEIFEGRPRLLRRKRRVYPK